MAGIRSRNSPMGTSGVGCRPFPWLRAMTGNRRADYMSVSGFSLRSSHRQVSRDGVLWTRGCHSRNQAWRSHLNSATAGPRCHTTDGQVRANIPSLFPGPKQFGPACNTLAQVQC